MANFQTNPHNRHFTIKYRNNMINIIKKLKYPDFFNSVFIESFFIQEALLIGFLPV